MSSDASGARPRGRSRPRLALGASRKTEPHGLDLRVELERVGAHLASVAARLEAAERDGGVDEAVVVDPYGAGPKLPADAMGARDVPGPHAGGEAELGVVGHAYCARLVLEARDDHNRTEYLLAPHARARRDV